MAKKHNPRPSPQQSHIPPIVVRGWLHVIGMTIGMGLLWGSILGSTFWLATSSLPKMYIGVCIGGLMSIFTFISQTKRRLDEQELERLRVRLGHHTAPIGGGDISERPILELADHSTAVSNSEEDLDSKMPSRSESRWSLRRTVLPIRKFDKALESRSHQSPKRRFNFR